MSSTLATDNADALRVTRNLLAHDGVHRFSFSSKNRSTYVHARVSAAVS
jgi:hypothetical protein